ncbi:MAG: hypothetical protein GXP25_15085 [Planctomycetes bacterium]|nr:hypothetical protein [Planctomycetota bacterium]
MSLDSDLAQAIRQREIGLLIRLMFMDDPPRVRPAFCTEGELWDYKRDCPRLQKRFENAWADLAKEILGFHNNHGGVLVFGIDDDYRFVGASTRLDSKLLMDHVREYIGDRIWIEYRRCFIQPNQKYLGLALIPPRAAQPSRFLADAPMISGRKLFVAGWSAIRRGDSTYLLNHAETEKFVRQLALPTLGRIYAVDEPFYRILNPEFSTFVERQEVCQEIEHALRDPRTFIASVLGIGGVGKTALATWAVMRAYERGDFDFVVSITAKDRELTKTGILGLESPLTSFESLIDNVLDVLGFPDVKAHPIKEREHQVRTLLDNGKGLLYVDNLETVDDPRIVRFLDTLPVGVRALVTSRRPRVRFSVFPIDVPPITNENEAVALVRSFSEHPSLAYAANLSKAECTLLCRSCSGIPLAMRWVLARSRSGTEALSTGSGLAEANKQGDELLEFCFRRIVDEMPGAERAILDVLSLFQQPQPMEALVVGSKLPAHQVQDLVDELSGNALVQKYFDADRNSYCYSLLPIARAFVYAQVSRFPGHENVIRARLADWYEAKDITDPATRIIVREIRQGKGHGEEALLDLATAARRRNDSSSAQSLFEQAFMRNPMNWKVARGFAEFLRHDMGNVTAALDKYRIAAAHAPRHGAERALIFREYGMLLRDSGTANATEKAIECFETALNESPNDRLAAHALAHMLSRKGRYKRVIEVLEPFKDHPDPVTKEKVRPLLLQAYKKTGDLLKEVEMRQKER